MKCVYNINKKVSPVEECGKEARWEVGFSRYDGYTNEYSGENEYQQSFCDEHFIEVGCCGNNVEFRRIGSKEWMPTYEHNLELADIVLKSRSE